QNAAHPRREIELPARLIAARIVGGPAGASDVTPDSPVARRLWESLVWHRLGRHRRIGQRVIGFLDARTPLRLRREVEGEPIRPRRDGGAAVAEAIGDCASDLLADGIARDRRDYFRQRSLQGADALAVGGAD